MSRVLVTGGSGFIGSHVVDALRDAGHEPVIYDLRPSPWHARDEVETVVGDLVDLEALARAMDGCDAVAHLAAAADVNEVAAEPLAAEQVNCRGTASVLEAARRAGVGRVLYASTIWVYSDVDASVVDEDTPLQPPAHLYTATKLAGELYCRSYAELYGLEYTVLRFGIPYGPRARPAAVVPAMVGRALAGEPLTIAGDGSQTRRFVYVEDLAAGVVAGLAPVAANRIYNLVSDRDVSIRQVAETVRAVVGDVRIEHTAGRNGDFGGVEVDGSRAAAELGWTAATPFEEGVRRYVAHVTAPPPVPAPAVATRLAGVAGHARQVLVPVAVVGMLVAIGGAVGSLHQVLDHLPAGFVAMLLALPAAIGGGLHWEAARRRLVTAILVALAVCCLIALATPVPGSYEVREHHEALLLLLSSVLGAGLAAVGGRPVLQGLLSSS